MPQYPVYLETARAGTCLAHVPALPGCVVRAASREEVLRHLPQAIRDYHAWLRRHGERASPDDAIEVEVAGEIIGIGPFEPGDPAALFSPDRGAITPDEMERHFRLMAHSRADLLDLVRDLPEGVLGWQPDSGTFSIRRVLRHIGDAEEWYVSRIVDPETLPQEWEDDENLTLFEFLEMERRTVVARLRQLTDEERSGIFHPTQWASQAGEPWTVRKTLRRLLEHEREHSVQIREILVAQRTHLFAHLDAKRVRLLRQVSDLENEALEAPAFDGWSVKDVLLHIAAWDRWKLDTMQRMAAGEAPDLDAASDVDSFNAAAVTAWQNRTLDAVMVELEDARAELVNWLEALPEEELFRQRDVDGDDRSFPGLVQVQWEHEAEHAAQIAQWRDAEGLNAEEAS